MSTSTSICNRATLTIAGNEDGYDETVDLGKWTSVTTWISNANATLTAMIPAMITGMTHFIMRSGRRTDMAEMPTPDFAVP